MALTLSEIRAVVDNGDLQKFVGEFEGDHLDAKGAPYPFDAGEHAKREFAKDVAAFANASGGCIIIGAETTVANLQAGEQITSFKRFPEAMFNPWRHIKIVEEWVYPHPKGLVFKWNPDSTDSTNGHGIVFIPPQDSAIKPFLLRQPIHAGKATGLLIGYVERRVDGTTVKTIEEFHHVLRIGTNLEATVLSRIAVLEKHSSF